jgi:hypothetical protein
VLVSSYHNVLANLNGSRVEVASGSSTYLAAATDYECPSRAASGKSTGLGCKSLKEAAGRVRTLGFEP